MNKFIANKNIKTYLLIAFSVAFASQFYVNVFVDGFIIALAVIVFPVFLYYYSDVNPIKISLVTSIISPVFRGTVIGLHSGNFVMSYYTIIPEILFYITYGFFYFFLYHENKKIKTKSNFFIAIIFCDLFSNIVEISARTNFTGLNENVIKSLLAIAIVRTIIVQMVIFSIQSYKYLLMKEEHEKRYQDLMITTSIFKSEIFFMKKNIIDIESTMKKSFKLYKELEKNYADSNMKKWALDISKDIHEIKKDYIRVIKGLQNNVAEDIHNTDGMEIRDIIKIIKFDFDAILNGKDTNANLSIKLSEQFYVKEHFSLITILRNLIANSIESFYTNDNNNVDISIEKIDNYYIFEIKDNGSGIEKFNLGSVFDVGFSTKYDKKTGEFSRGIGLVLVKNLTEDKFNGSIIVESEKNNYTKFIIKLPCESI